MPLSGRLALRGVLRVLLPTGLAVFAGLCAAQPLKFLGRFGTEQQIAAPDCLALHWSQKPGDPYGCTEAQVADWRAALVAWRTQRLKDLGYNGSRYADPKLQWTQRSFVQTQLMVHDRYFYDPEARRYTVDRYLDDVTKRYGGIDSVLLWSIYPNIGIDARNQIELIENLPGGVAALKQVVAAFHRCGVKVLFPVMPWDTGTHALPVPLPEAIARLMAEIGADGVNGDTMTGVPESFSIAAEALGHPLAFEPEIAPKEDQLGWNLMSWGYFDYPSAAVTPAIHLAKLKWLEPRHMVHVNDRWQRQREDMLQVAFFNGTGFHSWENIWGLWNSLVPRDAEALRRIATVQRAMAAFLVSPGWEPLAAMRQYGLLASRWPLDGEQLWTVVNRNEFGVTGAQMAVPRDAGLRYFELFSGRELRPRAGDGGVPWLHFDIEAKGYAAVLATPAASAKVQELMRRMQAMTRKPLQSFARTWQPLQQRMVPVAPSPPATVAPAGMRLIPAGAFQFRVQGVAVEGLNMAGADLQFPWEDSPRRFHDHAMDLPAFYIDTTPVTNAQYLAFVRASGYSPADPENYLRHWQNGKPLPTDDDKPVTWVSLDDARAYARWAGKRLPRSWEWQYAAQGSDGRLYPWGNVWDASAVPPPDTSNKPAGPSPVGAHPQGASPFGVLDLVGNVWQWTDEFADEHTRSALLRGGSNYRPQGSFWYFPQVQRLDQHGKFLLMAPSMDRNAATGFRCAQDALPAKNPRPALSRAGRLTIAPNP